LYYLISKLNNLKCISALKLTPDVLVENVPYKDQNDNNLDKECKNQIKSTRGKPVLKDTE
jgi:hypothetical protein